MLQSLAFAATFGALSIGLSFAQSTSPKVAIPVTVVSPVDGRQMFTDYCAPCHGRDGRGEGPLASGLQRSPTNLTELARNNRGRFPELRMTSVLEFGVTSSGNHSSQMPVWGPVFVRISHLSPNDKDLRIVNLIRYLESIQAK